MEISKVFAWSHACLNPILYGFIGSGFRSRIRQAKKNFTKKSRALSMGTLSTATTGKFIKPVKKLNRMYSEPILLRNDLSKVNLHLLLVLA